MEGTNEEYNCNNGYLSDALAVLSTIAKHYYFNVLEVMIFDSS